MRRRELDAKLVALALQGVQVRAERGQRKQYHVRLLLHGELQYENWTWGSEFQALAGAVTWWEQQEALRARKRARRAKQYRT